MITICVQGLPTPQGSVKAFVVPGRTPGDRPRAVIGAPRGAVKSWRAEVANAVRVAIGDPRGPIAWPKPTPVVVAAIYRFPSPQAWPKLDGQPLTFKAVKPDRDKLDRAIGDAITAAGLAWTDDAQDAIGASAKLLVPDGQWTGVLIILGHAEHETAAVMSEFANTVAQYRQATRAALPARRGKAA